MLLHSLPLPSLHSKGDAVCHFVKLTDQNEWNYALSCLYTNSLMTKGFNN